MTLFLINTVLLEKNRWEESRNPSFCVSEWLPCFQADGFDGVELWENHGLKASEEEVQRLKDSPVPIEVYNSYVRFENRFEQERVQAEYMIKRLGAKKVKFNFGDDPKKIDEYMSNFHEWKSRLPDDCIFLCECHPGTVMEEPEVVEDVFNLIGTDRIGAIIHPFHTSTDVQSWFNHVGSNIVHAHVSFYNGEGFHLLDEDPDFIEKRIHALKSEGYKGDFSLEFTKATATKNETPERLYQNAIRDLGFLKDRWNGSLSGLKKEI